ncbi:VOC family protein [Kribbella speibonae]|uniref:VOC family protein n=1 Tax=Kribbella speibonae TaxID=1572660 RepID=UPI0013F3A6F7|nr:VOC family protein [Kribbella speibonae]
MVRVVLVGERGRAFVSVVLDEDGRVVGTSVDSDEQDGRFWVVVGCPEEREDELRAFYRMLTQGRIGTGEGRMRPPRWRDPAYPTQIHLDVQVADLEAAEQAVLERGATKLEEFPGWRVYADPVGHPFCLYPGLTEPTDRLGTLVRVVIDCADPRPMAEFWGAMLDMPRTVEDSPDRIVIARDDDRLPMLALQRVPDYQRPRWPDPDYPPQMHFDIGVDDRAAKERLALERGGTRLPPQGGSCPVYADPAGHPFCLCYKGE